MRLRRRLIWIPLALAGPLFAAGVAPGSAQMMIESAPTPYGYHGPNPHYGPGTTFGPQTGQSCYVDSLNGRVCVD